MEAFHCTLGRTSQGWLANLSGDADGILAVIHGDARGPRVSGMRHEGADSGSF